MGWVGRGLEEWIGMGTGVLERSRDLILSRLLMRTANSGGYMEDHMINTPLLLEIKIDPMRLWIKRFVPHVFGPLKVMRIRL